MSDLVGNHTVSFPRGGSNTVLGKEARSDDQRSICKAERDQRERKAKTTGPLVDSMTLTCST